MSCIVCQECINRAQNLSNAWTVFYQTDDPLNFRKFLSRIKMTRLYQYKNVWQKIKSCADDVQASRENLCDCFGPSWLYAVWHEPIHLTIIIRAGGFEIVFLVFIIPDKVECQLLGTFFGIKNFCSQPKLSLKYIQLYFARKI